MSSEVRVRFAPSPTGYLHIGGARTALFNWLFARHHGGKFVLRIEDTDMKRNTEEAMAAIYEGLDWLGLNWDEGPHVGGEFGPYLQSERTELYERYLKKLQDAGHIYEDQGALRFRSPREHVIVDDIVHGKIDFDLSNEETHPDMTIRRPDGSWIFHFVNVIDDLEMKISHVIRGEDHLSNTPKHIELIRALGATPPQYAQIPLILNRDGTKMSKRDASARVEYYIQRGYLPAAVRNYLCLLGWSPKDNREKLDIDEIIRIFDLKNIGRSAATFDPDKMLWLNGQYMLELTPAEFIRKAKEYLSANYPNFAAVVAAKGERYIDKRLRTCIGKIKTFEELLDYAKFYLTEDFEYDLAASRKYLVPANRDRLTFLAARLDRLQFFNAESIEKAIKAAARDLKIKPIVLAQPVRVATTGRSGGPSLYHLLEELGQLSVRRLLHRAIDWIEFSCKRPIGVGFEQ